MKLLINYKLITDLDLIKLRSKKIEHEASPPGKEWALAIELRNNQTVALYPASRYTETKIHMTQAKASGNGASAKERPAEICQYLNRWCKSAQLADAIRLLQKALNTISEPRAKDALR